MVRPISAPCPFFSVLTKIIVKALKFRTLQDLILEQLLLNSAPLRLLPNILNAFRPQCWLHFTSLLHPFCRLEKMLTSVLFHHFAKLTRPCRNVFPFIYLLYGFANVRLLFCGQVLPFGARRDSRSAGSIITVHRQGFCSSKTSLFRSQKHFLFASFVFHF